MVKCRNMWKMYQTLCANRKVIQKQVPPFSLQILAEVVEKQADEIKQLKIQNRELRSNERKLWESLERITQSNRVAPGPEIDNQLRNCFVELFLFKDIFNKFKHV